ncbi:transcription-repair coupling factor [Pseudonocardia spinosispora]|uniref:transcription-repair coupling factor n=1 Tax=Pseudonocardia spinosispora TaxID=103441 RepID=UPI0005663220|nr:transcription-repair coupling factor [Pseudonocardia spinosispora]
MADPGLGSLVDSLSVPSLRIEGPAALRPLVTGALARATDVPATLAVCATERECEELASTLRELVGEDAVAILPSWETLPHERLSPRSDTVGKRIALFHRLASGDDSLRVVVAAVRSLIQPIAPGLGRLEPIALRVGDTHDFDELLHRLVELAYTRVDMVTGRGEFAVRGGIVDVFAPTAEHPVRVEMWGDEVSELRQFAVADQRSIGPADQLDAPPCRELLLTEPVRARAAQLAEQHESNQALSELLGRLAEGIPAEGMESLIPVLCEGSLDLLTDLMPAGSHVLVVDPERIRTRARDLVRTGIEFLEASWLAAATGPAAKAPIDLGSSAYRDLAEISEHALATGRHWWTLSPFNSDEQADTDDYTVRPGFLAAESYRGDISKALDDLRKHTSEGGSAVLLLAGAGTAQRAMEQLAEAEVPAKRAQGSDFEPEKGVVTVAQGVLTDGFYAPALGLLVLTEADLTGNRVATGEVRKLAPRRRNAVQLETLQPGDFVVHSQHGIGRFVEMRERTVSGAKREYLVLEYASSKRGQPADRLFVPTDQLDEISRYVGGEQPVLNKMGGGDWAKTKSKARRAVRQIAAQLVQLYAARKASPGHAFAPDTPWQREMEDAFPHTETPDQLSAINEVKADMEQPVPMDRVVSGDVGFGKTEIAVRAAFKAVQDGKQVAVLVPTTLLASQHLQTFQDRMRSFPVNVKGLSRFTDGHEATETIKGLAEGTVDVVVGTHRLLQNSVRWKDLGLVIIDEEQRFGVEHKEHITALRAHVDMLSMSATPIPRTLEMSLAGIRELSTIATPPEERHPVLTYVGAYDRKQVGAAIRRELLRDGQVFYVHNRVSSIDRAAATVREMVPEARVAVAHGQMNEELLERTVAGFWQNEFDVLVCTTIVENGLDISNANTLIVERSENLGLSQLHQLRGRVGRGRERGYAYFLYPGETPLTETAHDRLATIAQHSELGSGTAVAMKDLEIRGAGNILGAEQSGHIAGVGFDLYVRLVGEAVAAFRQAGGAGAAGEEETLAEVRVELPVDAHVAHDYVTGERLRLEVYRKIAEAGDGEALDAIVAELTDRYGTPPEPVRNLISVAAFRQTCRRFGIAEVAMAGSSIRFSSVELPESAQLRLRRLHPRSTYKAVAGTIVVPRPAAGSSGGGQRMGAAPMRDTELLDWCAKLLADIVGPTLAAPGSGSA